MTAAAPDFPDILQHFDLAGHFDSASPLGGGHINDTYLIRIIHADARKRYVLQRLNAAVFPQPLAVMENIERIVQHIRKLPASRLEDGLHGQPDVRLLPTRDGRSCWQAPDGALWRLWPFIYGASAVDTVEAPRQAREAARAFGVFQSLIHDMPGPPLHETIGGFHDTVARFRQLHNALGTDVHNRATMCAADIETALAFEAFARAYSASASELPVRVVHNDAKINNVMLDDRSGEAVCVIDLDTVMPGIVLNDFGDMVRTMTVSAAEDETDLAAVTMSMELYEEIAAGYLDAAHGFLSAAEIELLPEAGIAITVETGVRFLTDYLSGDSYFRTEYERQNLDRCRAQFALARSINSQVDAMQRATCDIANAY